MNKKGRILAGGGGSVIPVSEELWKYYIKNIQNYKVSFKSWNFVGDQALDWDEKNA